MTRTLCALVAALAVVSCTGPRDEATDTRRDSIPVTTITLATQSLPAAFEAGGVVRADASATIASRTLANVVAVRVRGGDRVAAGDLLVQLDDRDLTAQQRRAMEAATAVQRAHAAALAERDAATAALTLARAANERISGLFGRNAATTQERDEATASLRAAEAHAAAADARVAQLSAEINAAQQAATAAEVASSFATVRAPFAGIVVERLVDPGDLVSPGTPLLRLDGTGAFRLDTSVDEARIGAIAPGARAQVLIDEGAGPVEGEVTEIVRASGAGTHAFVVKVALPPAELRSGLFGRARFTTGSRQALAVPRRAVVQQGQLATAWVVTDGRARMRVIALGEPAGSEATEVVAGLAAGDRVIVSPPPQLRDGDPVTAAGGR